MTCFYKLHSNPEYKNAIIFSFGFNGYIDNINGLKENLVTNKMNFSGSIPTDTMAKIMNTTLVDFFNYTLKQYDKVNSITYKEKFPQINIILDK